MTAPANVAALALLAHLSAEGRLVSDRARAAAKRGAWGPAAASLWTWRRRFEEALERASNECLGDTDREFVETSAGLLAAARDAENYAWHRAALTTGARA